MGEDIAEPLPKAGRVEVLWIVATSRGPITTAEIADLVDPTRKTVRSSLMGLWRSGFVVRRKTEGRGGPYEYALAMRGER